MASLSMVDFCGQDGNLGGLAAKTEDGCAGDVGMMDVSGDEAAKIVGVFSSTAAAAFVEQETDTVHIFEELGARRAGGLLGKRSGCDFGGLPLFVEARELSNLAAIDLRSGEAEFLFEGLLEHADIAVFAEDQRNDQPVIARADLAVGAMVATKSGAGPVRNIGRSPVVYFGFFVEGGGIVANIASGEGMAFGDRLDCFADENPVHEDGIAGGEIANGEFVLGGDRRAECEGLASQGQRFTLAQILQGDEYVVVRVELEDFGMHTRCNCSTATARAAKSQDEARHHIESKAVYATTCWRDWPKPSMPSSTMSPGFRYCGGFMPRPTPAGVPVLTTSPGRSVMNWLM